MYTIAAGNGRGEALFGNSYELARPAYERTLIGDEYPRAYLEFPLLGEPCFDLLSLHARVGQGDRFAPGAGFGLQPMFDWFAGACGDGGLPSVGIELDTSVGETERAGVYLQQRPRHELVEPFLASVGEARRACDYLEVLGRMPEGWPPAYVGLFPGRSGTPMRIGGYMDQAELVRCANDPSHLGECFRRIGFTAFDDQMLGRCAEFMRLSPSVDFQFDIMPNGSLGSTFGLSLSFNDTMPREARECMESGYGERVMRVLQDWKLADERWRLIAGAAFARHVGYERDDGKAGRFALCIRFNYAKVKFVNCEPQPAKFYLTCVADQL